MRIVIKMNINIKLHRKLIKIFDENNKIISGYYNLNYDLDNYKDDYNLRLFQNKKIIEIFESEIKKNKSLDQLLQSENLLRLNK